MSNEDTARCPTCGHAHPNGIGAGWCTCDDCSLLWTTVPTHLLTEESRNRLAALHYDQRQSVADRLEGS